MADWVTGTIDGPGIEESAKTLGQLAGLFLDEQARLAMDPLTEVYRVRYWHPVPEGTTGGLFWGATTLYPGLVGDEYFMTYGHSHVIRDRAEIYATSKGSGVLMLMSEDGECRTQQMTSGSVHYIPGTIAHRVVNTGDEPLIFFASWPSDAGHDYERIRNGGFSKRVLRRNGVPCVQ
jgi:glucose-6-phosphate isomerase, archaeal